MTNFFRKIDIWLYEFWEGEAGCTLFWVIKAKSPDFGHVMVEVSKIEIIYQIIQKYLANYVQFAKLCICHILNFEKISSGMSFRVSEVENPLYGAFWILTSQTRPLYPDTQEG